MHGLICRPGPFVQKMSARPDTGSLTPFWSIYQSSSATCAVKISQHVSQLRGVIRLGRIRVAAWACSHKCVDNDPENTRKDLVQEVGASTDAAGNRL